MARYFESSLTGPFAFLVHLHQLSDVFPGVQMIMSRACRASCQLMLSWRFLSLSFSQEYSVVTLIRHQGILSCPSVKQKHSRYVLLLPLSPLCRLEDRRSVDTRQIPDKKRQQPRQGMSAQIAGRDVLQGRLVRSSFSSNAVCKRDGVCYKEVPLGAPNSPL